MKTWPKALDQSWFVVARADRVGHKPVAITLLGRPLVLARLDGKQVTAFEDRCPHRQAPLSAGCVVRGALQCPYHGWRFDPSGALVELPGMPEGGCLPSVRARKIDIIEHDRLIWARLDGEQHRELPGMIRSLPSGQCRFLWQATWHASAVDILENLLDPMHTHFVHHGLIRFRSNRREIVAHCASTPEGFTVQYSGSEQQSGLIYRLFESPREFERAHFSAAGSVQYDYGYRNGSRVRISVHVTPESDTCCQVFATLHIDGRQVPSWFIRLVVWPFIRKVAQQDAHMLALQSANAARFPQHRDAITPYDIVRRRLLRVWDAEFRDLAHADADSETRMRL